MTNPPSPFVCPLCGATGRRPSWLGALRYGEREFPYSECTGCGSSICDPMPTDEVVRDMYGVGYTNLPPSALETADPKTPGRVLEALRHLAPGVFVDYGCGTGSLLVGAAAMGWRAIGIEYDPEVASAVARRTGLQVVPVGTPLPLADVLHLGDVIEHLTRIDQQLPRILDLVRPGGTLVAQGPLEANLSLFTGTLKAVRRVRRGRNTEMPPYHVILATAPGQLALFERLGLERLTYEVTEVDWPAPSRIAAGDLLRPKAIALFALRRLSRGVTALGGEGWGNRYFYVGRRGPA